MRAERFGTAGSLMVQGMAAECIIIHDPLASTCSPRQMAARVCISTLILLSPLPPPVAKRQSEDIGKSVAAATKELAIVRKEAEANEAILTKLDAIEKHLAVAMDHHKMMHEVCCKDHVEGEKSADCCSDMITELEKAQAEQRALMRLLNPPKPISPPKPATADK